MASDPGMEDQYNEASYNFTETVKSPRTMDRSPLKIEMAFAASH